MSYPLTLLMDQRTSGITDTISAGKLALWFENDIVKIKYGTTTRTLGIGLTLEEVQDLLQNSFNDTASIKWTYNDANNYFEANLDTTLQGLISSALQPNANISTLTNNLGFETPTQLNSRDTVNRQRSNHTGSQESSTISNFASTVRATILTGLSIVTGSAVVAGDSILSAMGKLQGQVNTLLLRVFGNQAEDFLDTTQVNYSGVISELKSFTTQDNPPGRYRVAVQVQFEPSQGSTNDFFDIRVDGTAISLQYNNEPKDTGGDVREVIELKGYYQNPSQGTFNIEIWGGNQGGTGELNGALVEVWRTA